MKCIATVKTEVINCVLVTIVFTSALHKNNQNIQAEVK